MQSVVYSQVINPNADRSDCDPLVGVLTSTGSVTYAGFWRRAWAALIDVAILWVITFGVAFLIGLTLALSGNSEAAHLATVISTLISVVVNLLYFPLMESSAQMATLGKRVLGIRMTDELSGQRLTIDQAYGRYFGKLVSALTFGVGYLMAAWTEKKQCLHDKMAGTVAVVVTSGQTER